MELEKTEIISLLEDLNRNGSESALERLYALYYPRLCRYISILVKDKDSVEELVSDVFLAVWNNRKKILFPSAFTTYIYRIAKYKAINYLKAKKGEVVSLDHISFQLFEETVSVSPEYILISRQNMDKINGLIDSLPAKCKMAFKLVKEDKLTYKEAAEIMEVSVNTIDAHIFKAVKIIKEELEKPTPVKERK